MALNVHPKVAQERLAVPSQPISIVTKVSAFRYARARYLSGNGGVLL
jgi:hypothetical protein